MWIHLLVEETSWLLLYTLPTFTLPFFSSPSITFPQNQWSAPFCMSHSCILTALSILTDSTADYMSLQSGTRFQPRSPKACLVSWKVTNLRTTWLPSPLDCLNCRNCFVCFNLLPPKCTTCWIWINCSCLGELWLFLTNLYASWS